MSLGIEKIDLAQGPQTPRQAFTSRHTHPLVLNLMLLKEFGSEYLGWEPETCWVEISRTWGTTISEINRNKIQAVRTCHVTEDPYDRWEVFEIVATGLLGMPPKFDVVQRPTPHRAAFTLDVMQQINDSIKPSDEIYKYVAAVLLDNGVCYGPGPLEPCNKYVANLSDAAQQSRVRKAVSMRKRPSFNGKNDDDVQVMKATSIKDFLEYTSRLLIVQLKKLLP